MNTTKKGDHLEDKVYAVFTELISTGSFLASRECCQVYKKKGYYSKDREGNIVFDISIEITLPGQSTYSILVLIECKNYNHRVPVDDVEEFFSKTQQVSGCNVKGIIVSNNSFQKGAFTFSKSKGIGLARYYSRDGLKWELTRSPSGMAFSSTTECSNAYHGLTDENHSSRYFDFYCFIDEIYTNSLNQFISLLVKHGLESNVARLFAKIEKKIESNSRLVPYKRKQEIEKLCDKILSHTGYEKRSVSLSRACAFLSEECGLEVNRNSSLDDGVLGTISFDPLLIRIDKSQSETNQRVRFTLAHELGHLLLDHSTYMTSESFHKEDVDLDNPTTIAIKDVVRMEWQANYFASCLLLPTAQFVKAFHEESKKNSLVNRGHGDLFLDDQKCNIHLFCIITGDLMSMFNVSRSVVKIRLSELGFLNEQVRKPEKMFRSSSRKRHNIF